MILVGISGDDIDMSGDEMITLTMHCNGDDHDVSNGQIFYPSWMEHKVTIEMEKMLTLLMVILTLLRMTLALLMVMLTLLMVMLPLLMVMLTLLRNLLMLFFPCSNLAAVHAGGFATGIYQTNRWENISSRLIRYIYQTRYLSIKDDRSLRPLGFVLCAHRSQITAQNISNATSALACHCTMGTF